MDITLRINEVNPVHARISLFTSGKRNGIETTSRGLAGDLCIDAETLMDFIARLNPNRLTYHSNVPQLDDQYKKLTDYIIAYNENHGVTDGTS